MKWKQELAQSIRSVDDLVGLVHISEEGKKSLSAIVQDFPLLVTPYYLSLIDFSDKNDPIKKMALPSSEERDASGCFDTSGEKENTVVVGLQHKYDQTALMLSTNLCAMYCRHCFRKRMVGLPEEETVYDLGEVVAYVSKHPEINNVLVSGGDALMNSNTYLEEILNAFTPIKHLDFIRIASRIPVTLPCRITEDAALLDMLSTQNDKKQLYLVTQFNHPREITPESTAAVQALVARGIPVRNQTVLLRGVNDDSKTLGELLSGLVAIGVEPYYVFQCRPVAGVKSNFQVPLRQGYEIVEGAKALQSGFSKSFRYCMSHFTGKIEILGMTGHGNMLFKYHEARDAKDLGRIFSTQVSDDQTWLDKDPEGGKGRKAP